MIDLKKKKKKKNCRSYPGPGLALFWCWMATSKIQSSSSNIVFSIFWCCGVWFFFFLSLFWGVVISMQETRSSALSLKSLHSRTACWVFWDSLRRRKLTWRRGLRNTVLNSCISVYFETNLKRFVFSNVTQLLLK